MQTATVLSFVRSDDYQVEQQNGRYIKPDSCPLKEQLIEHMSADPRSRYAIANVSGCSSSMLKSWETGKTRRPQAVSIMLVARALGYSLKLEKQ